MRLGKYLSSLTKPELEELAEKLNISEDKKQNFINATTFFGNLLNYIWSEKENKNEDK